MIRASAYNEAMNPRRAAVILASFVVCFVIISCGDGESANRISPTSNTNSNKEVSVVPKTNVEELGMFVNIPYEAEESVWKTDASGKKLIAVLRFSAADCDKLVADSTKFRKPEDVSVQSESWFPDELIAQGDLSGDDTLKGVSYGANAFFQDAFREGSVVRVIGTNYFVLEMSSK